MRYYLDTSIWLNLFKKEGDSTKGIPFWKIAKNFIEKIKKDNNEILVSPMVMKALYFKAEDSFKIIDKFFKNEGYI